MEETSSRAVAIVGMGAVLPDAPSVQAFWENLRAGKNSIGEVPTHRWDPALYFDSDHTVPDKTYSKIGGWVHSFDWDPIRWHMPIPPKVAAQMDESHRWAVSAAREALISYGYPERPLNTDRTAVILGSAMAGEKHYETTTRIQMPEVTRELEATPSFHQLPSGTQQQLKHELMERTAKRFPEITEDTMPGELSNCMAGRIASLYNLHGRNYICDAACASTFAALSAAIEGLTEYDFDAVLVGGVDRNMGVSSFVKFCKIGALSATGSRPFSDGADGFVMGEGAAIFLLKRLADAERDGDTIYAVIRGIGGASDGKGKGITAPNPAGQRFAVERAWHNAGLDPATVSMIEGHGTSTKVGDMVEVNTLIDYFGKSGLKVGSVALGSVKSNIGHLKGAAGAAGMLKTVLSLHHKEIPPTINFVRPNPTIDFAASPFFVNTELRPWALPDCGIRRAAVSSFGFGGTNFHVILEEYIPGRLATRSTPVNHGWHGHHRAHVHHPMHTTPMRGALVLGAASTSALVARLKQVLQSARNHQAPRPAPPLESDLRAAERLVIDYGSPAELADRAEKALRAFESNSPATWKALRSMGIFRGQGQAGKVAFLFTGQGSQYVNMLRQLREKVPVVADTFREADEAMRPILGTRPLSDFVFTDPHNAEAVAAAEENLKQTAITQPAVLAVDIALTRLLEQYGIEPDMVIGHSLGEYAALVAAGAIPFSEAVQAVSARGRHMTLVATNDNGKLAAVFAPLDEVKRILAELNNGVVVANYNSMSQSVIGGETQPIAQAIAAFQAAGHNVVPLPVSHAFHTHIVAPATEPLKAELSRMHLAPPEIPVVANVTGKFYPMDPGAAPEVLELLGKQVASPVHFVDGLETLYDAGVRVFVEVGPKKALHGFVEDVLGTKADVVALFTNHPKVEDVISFNQALCGLYAAGLGDGEAAPVESTVVQASAPAASAAPTAPAVRKAVQALPGQPQPLSRPVVITGASLGLPGRERMFSDDNINAILHGEQLIDVISSKIRKAIVDKHITRLVKSEVGGASFEHIDSEADVIKLAGRPGAFDLEHEFGVSAERIPALDVVTRMAIAAGLDAMRDAGLPLIMRYKTTTRGTQLPDRWGLPDALRDDTGVIFASAFPGFDSFSQQLEAYFVDHARREHLTELERMRTLCHEQRLVAELDRRIHELRALIEHEPYEFDRRFLFRVLSMGHSQFAEWVGARGPNTQINAACASGTQAVGLAEDWIRAGRCRRVIILSADSASSDHMLEWIGAGFLASGAAATDDIVEEAALPFDRRRHGMIIGMAAASVVVESAEAAEERGLTPICEVLSAISANSAYHGTRLDVHHISDVMEKLVVTAETRWGINRATIAAETLFMSHETYTPARGGSAAAEITAIRQVFKDGADKIVMANTKGFTGHAMGAGVEDVVAMKALETGLVPPIPNFKEADPDLGNLNLSQGGLYNVSYAIRLAAGFGSQVAMMMLRRVPAPDGHRRHPDELGYSYRIGNAEKWKRWLMQITGSAEPVLEVYKRTLRIKDAMSSGAPHGSGHGHDPVPPTPAAQTKSAPPTPLRPLFPQNVAPAAPTEVPAPSAVRTAHPSPVGPAPVQPSAPPGDVVLDKILGIVAEKTGYPRDMLAPELDLEADLGIDTVKQAELFVAVRETWGIERDPNLKLRDFPTLLRVAQFVYDKRPDLSPSVGQAHASQPSPTPASALPGTAGGMTDAPSTASPTASASGTDTVLAKVLEVVSEKTGYPSDMLDPALDLEADLGIDTVKQAELFAAVRETWNIERDPNLKLRDFPTLQHVAKFVYDRRPDLKAAVAAPILSSPTEAPVAGPARAAESATPAQAVVGGSDAVLEQVLKVVSEKTGYPSDMLDPALDLEADLGIDTVKQAELFAAVREIWGIQRDPNLKLRDFPTLQHVAKFVYDRRPDLKPASAQTAAPAPQVQVTVQTSTYTPASAERNDSSSTGGTTDPVLERVLLVVSEKTGYPADMLDPGLDLEADLGIDTVKQAELFAAVREIWGIQRDPNLKLRDFPTLQHVAKFVYDKRPDLAPKQQAKAAPAAPAVAVPAVAAPTQVSSEAASPSGPSDVAEGSDSVLTRVMQVVSEKTGYPPDMLDPGLDLEADLGVDTVKQAELFATVRSLWGIERDPNLKLRDFPTLKHVAEFVYSKRPELRGGSGSVAPTVAPQPAQVVQVPPGSLDEAGRIPRRVPIPVIRPALELCQPTQVAVQSGSRVVIMADTAGVGDALGEALKSSGAHVLLLSPERSVEEIQHQLQSFAQSGPIAGVFWLPALDHEGALEAMTLADWREALRRRVKLLYSTMRTLVGQVGSAGTFLISGTRLGGAHGYDAAGASAPLGGSVTGFTKAFKRENPEALVKALDFEANASNGQIVETLLAELRHDPGAVEIGYQSGHRLSIALQEQPVEDGATGMTLNTDTVFVVSGAAGSIVSAITIDLARASRGTFYLVDKVAAPDRNSPDIPLFRSDKEALKRALFERLKARGERATPAMVERELAGIERSVSALDAILAIEAAGGRATWISVDLRDGAAVTAALAPIREAGKRVGVLLHAAGLEISRFLADKEPAEFDLVFDVKADGWFNLLQGLKGVDPEATVCFSSIAGRFGNGGQTDYASANDLLCKTSSAFRSSRPGTRGIVIDWTAWGGIGMAARGSIPKMMAAAGIGMLPPEQGVPFIRRELVSGGRADEVVAALELGIMLKPLVEGGGLSEALLQRTGPGPVCGHIRGLDPERGLIIETTLDPKAQGFLFDHRINGTPVLPGVMGLEAFAEAATALLPGWHVRALEDARFLTAFKFYRDEPRSFRVEVILKPEGAEIVAICRLVGTKPQPGKPSPVEIEHFSGRVRLSREAAEVHSVSLPAPAQNAVSKDDIYRVYFHGPTYQVLDQTWKEAEWVVGQLASPLPANHEPAALPTLIAPRLIELCLQTAGALEIGTTGKMGLPQKVGKLTLYPMPEHPEGAHDEVRLALVRPEADGCYAMTLIDGTGQVLFSIEGYQTVTFAEALPDALRAPLATLGA